MAYTAMVVPNSVKSKSFVESATYGQRPADLTEGRSAQQRLFVELSPKSWLMRHDMPLDSMRRGLPRRTGESGPKTVSHLPDTPGRGIGRSSIGGTFLL
jgi:hypothetical protein